MKYIFVYFLTAFLVRTNALSCLPCDKPECTPPQNCKGGQVLGVCGCCMVCAKQEGETCQGLFGLSGRCDKGLGCYVPAPIPGDGDIDESHREGKCMKTRRDCYEVCYRMKTSEPAGFARFGRPAFIDPDSNGEGIEVYCDCTTKSNPWTVVQRRSSTQVTFNRNWYDYENGFGYSNEDFWTGLKHMNRMTTHQDYELKISISYQGESGMSNSVYRIFQVGDADSKYQLTIGDGYGSYSSSFIENHNGMKFSCSGEDNDLWEQGKCAEWYGGGWWFNSCTNQNLNGVYYGLNPFELIPPGMTPPEINSGPDRIIWKPCSSKLAKTVEMKIRRVFNVLPY